MKAPLLVVARCLLAAASISAAPAARRASVPVTGETVILPDFTVQGRKELPPPEAWQYGKLEDGMEVLSNASERATRKLLRDFQMFQQALALAWPAVGESNAFLARTLILCGRREKFADFASPDPADRDLGATSRFVRDREQAAIIVDLQASTVQLTGLEDDGTSGATVRFEVDPDKQLYREFVRFLLTTGARRPPAWLQEGIAQIVMAMEFAPDYVKLGQLDESTDVGTVPLTPPGGDETAGATTRFFTVPDRGFNQVLRRRALIPMDELFAVTSDAPEANNPLGNNRWAKQAYAFVHLCLYGEEGRYRAAFEEFTKRLKTQPVSEALFKECFKLSYQDMLFALRAYIDVPAHRADLFKLTPGSPRFGGAPIVMREATQGEVGRIKGDAQRLAGRVNDALTSYSDAYARGEREPMLLASYGVAAGETGQSERALALLEMATQKPGTRRPSAYVELSRQRLIAAKAKVGASGKLDQTQFASVVEPLLKARSIGVPLPGIYVGLADAWLASATPPQLQDFALLGEGLRQFPRELPLLRGVALLYQRVGQAAAAGQVAQLGLRFADTPTDRGMFEQLLATLPPPSGQK
jgi:tetratricopeptide (TPR) repeat protein